MLYNYTDGYLPQFVILVVVYLRHADDQILVQDGLRAVLGYVELTLGLVALDQLGDHDDRADTLVPHHQPEVVYGVGHGTLGGYVRSRLVFVAGYRVGVYVRAEQIVITHWQFNSGGLVF